VLEVKRQPTTIPGPPIPPEGVSIAEAARRTGVGVHTLRYYERAGLVVSPIDRTAAGLRRYRQADLDWVWVCTKLRATGMGIRTIRRYAELIAAGPGTEPERLALMESHRAAVVAQLSDLRDALSILDYKIDVYRHRL
jgi:DNA-binding transcriptional MerR regulator